MTKKGKVLIIFLIIIGIILKEEIYDFLFKIGEINKTNAYVCSIKNEEILQKYQELENAYHYQDLLSYHTTPSKILYRDIYNLSHHITIYKGSKEGIKEKNLVVNSEGLVGIVTKVNKNSSEVDLLIHENINLSVKINDNYGILKYEEKELVIKGINNKGKIEKGDKVYTSDISIYPENVFIGEVSEISFDNYEIEKIVKIIPAVNFENLKYISVITDLRGEE